MFIDPDSYIAYALASCALRDPSRPAADWQLAFLAPLVIAWGVR